jgi:hypothetical protein
MKLKEIEKFEDSVNLKHIESIYDGKYQSKRQNDSI